MKTITISLAIFVTISLSSLLAVSSLLAKETKLNENLEISFRREEISRNDISSLSDHQREIWLSTLEWCESRGIPSAVNSNDSDGTPSFGAFQFKPSTFLEYQQKYNIPGNLMDYDAQLAILKQMLDDPAVKWAEKEFPGCIKKIGLPPKKF